MPTAPRTSPACWRCSRSRRWRRPWTCGRSAAPGLAQGAPRPAAVPPGAPGVHREPLVGRERAGRSARRSPGAFIGLVVIVSIVSRAWRCTEFRFEAFDFADKATELEWERLKAADFPILVPMRPGQERCRSKEIDVRTRHRIPGTVPIVFVVAELADPSDFHHRPLVRIARENGRVVIHITRCCRSRTLGRGGAGDRVRRAGCRRSTSAGRWRTR